MIYSMIFYLSCYFFGYVWLNSAWKKKYTITLIWNFFVIFSVLDLKHLDHLLLILVKTTQVNCTRVSSGQQQTSTKLFHQQENKSNSANDIMTDDLEHLERHRNSPLVKSIRKGSDFTPICTNETSNIIILIICKIRTERNNGEECSLRYQDGGDFVHECDSRFSLKPRNQTVFLHLTCLTAADSGNYSCECSNLHGTYFLHFSITVNESNPDNNPSDEVWSQSAAVTLPSALTAMVLLMIIVSVILVFIYRRRSNRGQPESCRDDLEEDLTEIEPYSSYTQKENSLYSTATLHSCQINSDYANIFS
ncbi:uncharacterized protein LOC129378735 isoform X2 [Poeciliopsis prolifica]|uniref:uncharacterized protein LOC129378735 isoform X2 n=1 Tax=Poeciliopsis prolifica TaxID=188132 RepID=UPI0024141C03|nr:uncharacterized protein LOC129378735 isoform X2 [Poeciliopsis prolifica]